LLRSPHVLVRNAVIGIGQAPLQNPSQGLATISSGPLLSLGPFVLLETSFVSELSLRINMSRKASAILRWVHPDAATESLALYTGLIQNAHSRDQQQNKAASTSIPG
jgi:hypothetical protein